jgi:hypothetical protein
MLPKEMIDDVVNSFKTTGMKNRIKKFFKEFQSEYSYLPIEDSRFYTTQRERQRQFTRRRIEISKYRFPCVCAHASDILQCQLISSPGYTHERERFIVHRGSFLYSVKCCPTLEYCRTVIEENEIRNKMASMFPADLEHKLLRGRFYRDEMGIEAYRKSVECVEGDRFDYEGQRHLGVNIGVPKHEIRTRNLPLYSDFRSFVVGALKDKVHHVCPPLEPQEEAKMSPPPKQWTPRSYVFKTIGWSEGSDGKEHLAYKLQIYTVPDAYNSQERWFKTYVIAEEFFPYEPNVPGAPQLRLWKINGERRPRIGEGVEMEGGEGGGRGGAQEGRGSKSL